MASLLLRKSYTQCVIFQEGLTLDPLRRRDAPPRTRIRQEAPPL
ncbi:hypothetical protein HMPREF0004_5644 [Achromobacter piechaudii ATCC 43553]|uniref:Uncharacterized protein n=1 Tax=Achromobacter piechaudii ATCC 43553 TaxID=742159 RepID=D4XJJ7_9BURK|nr:hypothetical protein HMPREF0004_5644 [Achromobacter piechaudii ATCC 43553]